MQKPLLFVLIVALALGGLLGYFILGTDSDAAAPRQGLAFVPEERGAAPAQGAMAPGRAETAAEESAAPAPSGDGRVSALAELADVGERRTWDRSTSIFVEGRVLVPPTCPADEAFEVVAIEADGDPVGRVRDFPLSDDVVPTGFLERLPVERDGAFRLGLPPDVKSAWLLVRGKYLYSKSGVRVELGAGTPTALLEPSVGAWISGVLVPPADATDAQRDMEGTPVRLEPERLSDLRGVGGLGPDAPPSRGTKARSDLTFEVHGVQTGRSYTLGAVPELLAVAKSASFDPKPGERVRIELPLTHGATVIGRVVDESGKPVAGAELEVRVDTIIYGQGGLTARATKSGEDGSFRLAAIPAGGALLAVERDGFIPGNETLDLLEGQVVEELELALSRGRRVSGRVVWPDASPAIDARVELSFDMSQMGGMAAFNAMSGAEGSAETDDDGAFAITGLGNGPFTVRASVARIEDGAAEGEPGRVWLGRVDGVRPDSETMKPEERIEIALEPPIGIAGRVVDGAGRPIAKFQVHARSEEGGLFAGFGSDRESGDFEDEDGRFLLDGLRPGEWQIVATAEGFGFPLPIGVTLPRPDDAEPIELVLYRLARVSGIVLDPDGRPVGGADVGRQKTVQELRRSSVQGVDSERTRSGKDGKFTIEGITPGSVSLAAEAAGFAEGEPVAIEVEPAGTADGIVLTLRVGGRLTGEIYDAAGEPESGRAILVQRPSALGLQRWAKSDGDGKFTIEHLIPGSYQVLAMPDQKTVEGERGDDDFTSIFAEMRLTMAEIRDEEETFVQLGSPPGDPVRVHGKVELDGDGVGGVMVTFVPDGGEGAMRYATSDAQGKYEVELNGPGRFMVSMQKVGGTGQSQSFVVFEEVPETDDHRLNLGLPIGRITGRVIGADGRPAVNERVTLFSDGARLDGNYAEAQTDEDGNYDLTWLRAGTYNVAAGGVFMGGVIGEPTGNGRQLKSGVRLDEGEWLRDVDFRMQESGRLEGRVVDERGSPVSDASIYLYDEQGRRIEAFSTVVTDAAGRFEYEGVEPGTYSVRARARGRATPEPVRVRLKGGETVKPELKLDTGTMLVVKLTDEAGEPVQAGVEVFDENDQEVGGMLSLAEILEIFMQGKFSSTEPRVGPLPAGRYKVVAEALDGRSATKLVTLSGQEERTLKLRLK